VELNAALHALTPPEYCYHLTVEQMAEPDTTVFIAREGGCAIACGVLKRHAGGIGEVKRMYTKQAWQGQGIGGRLSLRSSTSRGLKNCGNWFWKPAIGIRLPGACTSVPDFIVAAPCSIIRIPAGLCSTRSRCKWERSWYE
jgi:GNAT superfamily N-acetyltransferase